MKPLLRVCVVLTVLCGSAWGNLLGAGESSEFQTDSGNKAGEEEEGALLGTSEDQPNSPCLYKGKIFTIDVRKIAERFKRVNISFVDRYIYFLSICSPIACSFADDTKDSDAAACQYIVDQNEFVKLGKSASYKWHIENMTNFYITFEDGDVGVYPQLPRNVKVVFELVKSDNCDGRDKPTIRFSMEQILTLTYVFVITVPTPDEYGMLSLNDDIDYI